MQDSELIGGELEGRRLTSSPGSKSETCSHALACVRVEPSAFRGWGLGCMIYGEGLSVDADFF